MADGHSISDLKKQLASLTAELESRQKNIRHELKAEFEARLAEADLSIHDLYPELAKVGKGKKATGTGSREAVAAKYRNPNGPETWSGRGLAPRWLATLIASGKSKEDFAIKAA